MTNQSCEIVALWLGWHRCVSDPLETAWLHGWHRAEQPCKAGTPLVYLEHLQTGNGMVEIFEKMRTEDEEVRLKFQLAIDERLPGMIPRVDELTPEIVVECAAEVVK